MFKKGQKAWNKGKELSESHKQSVRVAMLGKKHTEATKIKMSKTQKEIGNGKWNLGRKASEETRQKMREKRKGRQPTLGQKRSIEQRKAQSERMMGENAPNYKGGVTPISMRLRGSVQYKIWREEVYKRDNYTCLWCGDNKGGNLEPDHIISFSSILDKIRFQYGVENLYENALKDNLLWDINNGRTLCIDCHKKTDTWGHKSNNKKLSLIESQYVKSI